MISPAIGRFLAAILVTVTWALPAGAEPAAPIVFVAPKPGQVFTPGERIAVAVRVLPPLADKVTDARLGATNVLGLAHPQTKDMATKTFRWSVLVPQAYTGPVIRYSGVAGNLARA